MPRSAKDSVRAVSGASSMTGFGRAEQSLDAARVLCEARSVNHRYLSLKLHVPPALMKFEPWIEAQARKCLTRGSVTLRIQWSAATSRSPCQFNGEVAEQYRQDLEKFLRKRGSGEELSLATILGLPGVMVPPDVEEQMGGLQPRLEAAVREALDELVAMRRREGERMGKAMVREAGVVRTCVNRIEGRAAKVPGEYRKRLRERLETLLNGTGVALDEPTLAREVAVLADRSDITEEIDRLKSHLEEIDKLLGGKGPMGRNLEFLVQELGREVQTIGSKAQDAVIMKQVLKAKSTLEKLREQAQNLE